jgi:hypothetical protein
MKLLLLKQSMLRQVILHPNLLLLQKLQEPQLFLVLFSLPGAT